MNTRLSSTSGNKTVGPCARCQYIDQRNAPPRGVPERSSVRYLLLQCAMRTLEARFHPSQNDQPEFIVVGRLVWSTAEQSERPIFQPSNAASVPDATVIKLRYLLAITAPDCFRGLQTLRSQFWSFVELPRDEGL